MTERESESDEIPNTIPSAPKGDRRRPWIALLSLTGLGFAAGTGALAHKHGLLQKAYDRLSEDLARSEAIAKDALSRANQSAKENERLREENRHQEGVIEMQTNARKQAEARAKKAEEREVAAKKRAEAAEVRAEKERIRAERAEKEAAEETERALALEDENRKLKESEEAAWQKNLGEALETLTTLERDLPEHANLESEERTVWLKHDCSQLKRLKYDLNRGDSNEAMRARTRRDALEQKYDDECSEAE